MKGSKAVHLLDLSETNLRHCLVNVWMSDVLTPDVSSVAHASAIMLGRLVSISVGLPKVLVG